MNTKHHCHTCDVPVPDDVALNPQYHVHLCDRCHRSLVQGYDVLQRQAALQLWLIKDIRARRTQGSLDTIGTH